VTGLQPGAVLIDLSFVAPKQRLQVARCAAQNFRTPQEMLRETFCTPILLKPALEVVQNERECNNIVLRRRRPHS
jgi:hypothetical protein